MAFSDIQTKIKDAASKLSLVAKGLGKQDGKAYEAWVLLELAARLHAMKYDVRGCNPTGATVTDFRLRGGPGHMPGVHDKLTTDTPSHLALSGSYADLELHISIEVVGMSEATHELDVSVLPAREGYSCRLNGGGPYRGHVLLGVELKAYDEEKTLPMGLPRALLGTAVDLDPTWAITGFAYSISSGEVKTFSRKRTRYALLTTTTLSESGQSLLANHGIMAGEELEPGKNEDVIDKLVTEISELLGPPPPPAPAPTSPPRRRTLAL